MSGPGCVDDSRVRRDDPGHGVGVRDESGGNERVDRAEVGVGALRNEVFGYSRVPAQPGQFERRARVREHLAAGQRAANVDAVPDEEAGPVEHVVGDRPGELAAHQVARRVQRLGHPGPPGTTVAGAESIPEHQLQMVVTRLEHPVVQRLPVIRIGTGVEQDGGERVFVDVGRLTDRPLLTLTEGTGERRERSRQPGPEVARIRVRAMAQQQPRRFEHGIHRDVRVVAGKRQVQQGRPSVRAAIEAGQARIGSEHPPRRGDVRRDRRGLDAPPRQLGIVSQDPVGARPPSGPSSSP